MSYSPVSAQAADELALVERLLATGDDHSCAISDGDVSCWGIDKHGQLGNGPMLPENQQSPTPIDTTNIQAGTEFVSVVAADTNTYALTSDGAAYCWGSYDGSVRGDGPGDTPEQDPPTALDVSGLPDGTTIVDVTAGEHSACAVAADGAAYCWGSTAAGRWAPRR